MKFHEEYFVKNSFFLKAAARHCFIYSIEELNHLEAMFLENIDYQLIVQQEEMDRYFDLIKRKSLDLQNKQFKIVIPKYDIVENYFYPEHSKKARINNPVLYENSKLTPVFLDGRFFNTQMEIYNFFNWDEICEESTTFSNASSASSLSDDSPRFH